MSGCQLRGGGGGWGQGPPCSMSDPVPPGLRKPTLPSPSQRRETLWGCGSYHFPYSSCTTSSIHPDRNTQPCPLSSLPALSHKLGHVTSTPASISYPPLTPKTHSVPSRTVTKAPLCPHAVGGSAADAPTQAFPRGPQLPAPRPPPTRAVPQALPSCGCSAELGPGPSRRRVLRAPMTIHRVALSLHGLPIPLASRPNLTTAPDGTHPPGDPHVPSSKPAP